VVWKLDWLGRDFRHLVNTVHELTSCGVSFKVLTGHGATIDTPTASGKLVFGFFAALAEFERDLIVEWRCASMAARARGRNSSRPYKVTAAKLRLAMASMGKPETVVEDVCEELGISRQALNRHVGPDGSLRADGRNLLGTKGAGRGDGDVRREG
jgi:DNA invertase Pin-like site-specific DNA recombinase